MQNVLKKLNVAFSEYIISCYQTDAFTLKRWKESSSSANTSQEWSICASLAVQYLLRMTSPATWNLEYLPFFTLLMYQPWKSPEQVDSRHSSINCQPTQKQRWGATTTLDLEMLMSSLVPNDLGLPLLIQITLCLLQRDCTQTINTDELMNGNLFSQCHLLRGLWLRRTVLWYQYLLSSLLNNSLKPQLSEIISFTLCKKPVNRDIL